MEISVCYRSVSWRYAFGTVFSSGGGRDDTSWRTLLASTLRTPGADIRGVSSLCYR